MKILVITEFIHAHRWRSDDWAPSIAVALARRGHGVTLACDGAHDPGVFDAAGGARKANPNSPAPESSDPAPDAPDLEVSDGNSGISDLKSQIAVSGPHALDPTSGFGPPPLGFLVRDPLRAPHGLRPLAFVRWAGRLLQDVEHDAAVSLTPLVPAPVWLPLGGPRSELAAAVRMGNPVSALLEVLHCPGLGPALAVEVRARRVPFTRLTIGPTGGRGDVRSLGHASRLDPPPEGRMRELGIRTRALLGIDPDAFVIALSGIEAGRGGLVPLLRGVADVARRGPRKEPVLLVSGRHGHRILSAARRSGCWRAVRFVGATARMDAVLAASDVAALPFAAPAGEGTGRFAADALRMGRPVLAVRQAPGAELLASPEAGAARPGVLIRRSVDVNWERAIRETMDEPRLGSMAAAAWRMSPSLSMDALAQRLEGVLGGKR